MSSKVVSIPFLESLYCVFCFGFSISTNANPQARFDEEALWNAMKAHYEEQLNFTRTSELNDHFKRTLKKLVYVEGYIKGEERSDKLQIGPFPLGSSYGEGVLVLKDGSSRQVYWKPPHGGNTTGLRLDRYQSKIFILIDKANDLTQVFQPYSRGPSADLAIGRDIQLAIYRGEQHKHIQAAIFSMGSGLKVGFSFSGQVVYCLRPEDCQLDSTKSDGRIPE